MRPKQNKLDYGKPVEDKAYTLKQVVNVCYIRRGPTIRCNPYIIKQNSLIN